MRALLEFPWNYYVLTLADMFVRQRYAYNLVEPEIFTNIVFLYDFVNNQER